MTQDILTLARDAIDAAREQQPGNPAFRRAIDRVNDGELSAAAEELVGFDDPSLVLATMFLERLAVAQNHQPVAALSVPLLEQVPAGSLDYGWVAGRFDQGWAQETAGHVAPDRTSKRADHGGFASLSLLTAVESLVTNGQLDKARDHLSEFGWYDKREAGRAHALVGVALDDAELMLQAVKVARKPPLIQDGGEEAEALGEVLAVFADGGVAADHPAVESCVAKLVSLGKTPVRKDVRSYGLSIGAVAAARRGGDWAAHARTLLRNIWTDRLQHPAQLLLASHHPDDEAELLATALSEARLFALYPEQLDDLVTYLKSDRGPLDRARLFRKHGLSDAGLIEQALQKAKGIYRGVEKIWGALSLADEERAEALLPTLKEPEEALVDAALTFEGEGDQSRADDYFRRALEAGFVPQWGTTSSILLRSPELLEAATEAALGVADREARMESLSLLSQLRIERREWGVAGDLVERAVEEPLVEEKPEWEPWSLMGDRQKWEVDRRIPVPTTTGARGADALAEVAALPRDEQLVAYYELAKELAPEALSDLRKKMKKVPYGRGDRAQMKKSRLVEVALIDGDFEGAFAEASGMRDCRVSGYGPSYTAETLAAWLDANPDAFTAERARAVVELFEAAIPQDIPAPLASVVRLLAPRHTPAQRQGFLQVVGNLTRKFRHESDRPAVGAIVAMGYSRCGVPDARAKMKDALEGVRQGSYAGRVFYLRRLQEAGLLDDRDLVKTVVTMPTGDRVYSQVMTLERCARILWHEGVESPLPALMNDGVYPSEVTDQLRRSLLVMAPDYSSKPVDDVLAVWLTRPPNEERAKEQVSALERALRKEGRGDEAEELRRRLAST